MQSAIEVGSKNGRSETIEMRKLSIQENWNAKANNMIKSLFWVWVSPVTYEAIPAYKTLKNNLYVCSYFYTGERNFPLYV